IAEGLDGRVAIRSELVIRFDYGHIVPWVRRVDHARVAVAGPDALCLRTPVELRGENMRTVAEFTLTEGDRVPFVLTWFPSHRDADAHRDAERRLSARSPRLARLATARGRRRPGRSTDHVRARRREAARRARARLAPGLRGLAPGARRQRRVGAVAARRLRRG